MGGGPKRSAALVLAKVGRLSKLSYDLEMAASSVLDSHTIDVIRAAIAAAAAGRTEEACEIGERGLVRGGDPAALHAMIGSLFYRTGDFDSAFVHLNAANEARPDDTVILTNLVRTLVELERYAAAHAILTKEDISADKSGHLRRLRAFTAQMTGDLEAAAKEYERVVTDEPGDWESWNNLGNARVAMGDASGALIALRRAAEINPRASSTRLNLAQVLRDAGLLVEAETELRQIADEFPDDPSPLEALFDLVQSQGGGGDCEQVLERALERNPRNIDIAIALGRQRLLRFDAAQAEHAFRRALELEPMNASAYLGLLDVFEHFKPQSLPELLAEAETAGAPKAVIGLIEAQIAFRTRQYRQGVDALTAIEDDFEPIQRWHLAGRLFDKMGEPDGAFVAFDRMNQALAKEPGSPLQRAAEVREELRRQIAETTAQWRDSWAVAPIEPKGPSPVFLVGFPRSGTTLLDTMLMGHPDVEVMEEQPILHQLRTEIGGFDAIAGMDEGEVLRLQNRYFELAGNHAELREGTTLIDKSPLHMQSVAQIYRLFPNSRFILALRHPADVVLSCFMAKFRLNSAMANFLQLDTAADFYDLTFSLWELSCSLFPIEVHTISYERMVLNPEAVLKPLVEELGLKWHPGIIDHQRTAEIRGTVTTASYAQVTEPLYNEAAGRWKRYRKHLEPVLPKLAPWIGKLDYEL
jgi:tetratricopeptide (TPR) repeat protein